MSSVLGNYCEMPNLSSKESAAFVDLLNDRIAPPIAKPHGRTTSTKHLVDKII